MTQKGNQDCSTWGSKLEVTGSSGEGMMTQKGHQREKEKNVKRKQFFKIYDLKVI